MDILDIKDSLVLIKISTNVSTWIPKNELPFRVPAQMPKSITEAQFLQRLGYTVPNTINHH